MRMMFGVRCRYFLLAVLFAIFTSAIVLSDSFRTLESEVSVLVVPRNGLSAASLDAIVSNMEHISTTGAFRSAFLAALAGKDDILAESIASADMPVSVRKNEGGSVLVVRATADDADDAKLIVRQAARSLFGLTGQYYNLKEDIDLRVTDGPTVSAKIASPVFFVLSSIALGAMVATTFFLVLFRLPNVISFFERKRRSVRQVLDAKVFEPEAPPTSFLRDSVETDREAAAAVIAEHDAAASGISAKSAAAPLSAHERTASAPTNLPAASDAERQFLQEFSFEGSLDEAAAGMPSASVAETVTADMPMADTHVTPDTPTAAQEPTEEEYKRRLNELLRG